MTWVRYRQREEIGRTANPTWPTIRVAGALHEALPIATELAGCALAIVVTAGFALRRLVAAKDQASVGAKGGCRTFVVRLASRIARRRPEPAVHADGAVRARGHLTGGIAGQAEQTATLVSGRTVRVGAALVFEQIVRFATGDQRAEGDEDCCGAEEASCAWHGSLDCKLRTNEAGALDRPEASAGLDCALTAH